MVRIGPEDTHIFFGWFRYDNRKDVLYSLIGTLQSVPDEDDEEQNQEIISPPRDELFTKELPAEDDWEFWGELESPLLGVLEISGTINYARGIMFFTVKDVVVPGVGLPPEDFVLNATFELSAQNFTWAGSLTHPNGGPTNEKSGQAEIIVVPVNHLSHKTPCCSKDVIGR